MKKLLIILLFLAFGFIPMSVSARVHVEEDITTKTINYKTFPITSIDVPSIDADALVIYTRNFGEFTNTDTKGQEAVIIDNRVTKVNQYNSYIPQNGYVISGHGKAKKFINDNIFEGADVEVDLAKSIVKLTVKPNNFLHEAYYRLEKVENILKENDENSLDKENMEFYIKRSKHLIDTAKKQIQFSDIDIAHRAADDAIVYADIALYHSMLYKDDEFKGVWVFPYQKTKGEIINAFDQIMRANIKNIFIEVFYNGMTIYNSDVAKNNKLLAKNPYYGDFDPLKEWVDLAKTYDKNIYVVFNTFNIGNPPKSSYWRNVARVHSKWRNVTKNGSYSKNDLYLDPASTEVQDFLLDLIGEVSKKYEITGIALNGLNYPENYGYTNIARNEFRSLYNIDPVNLKENDEKWVNYKADKIKEFVNRVISFQSINNSNLKLALNVYPTTKKLNQWQINENVEICPLVISADNNFAYDFLSKVKADVPSAKIYPIYFEPYLEEKPRYLFDQIYTARKLDILGVILYDYNNISKSYYDALKMVIFHSPRRKSIHGGPLVDIDLDYKSKGK